MILAPYRTFLYGAVCATYEIKNALRGVFLCGPGYVTLSYCGTIPIINAAQRLLRHNESAAPSMRYEIQEEWG